MKQKIAFLKKKAIVANLSKSESSPNLPVILTFNAELMNLGFILSENAYNALLSSDVKKEVLSDYLKIIKISVGADKNYTPMYKGFPAEVMDKSHLELYFNAIFHYWSNGEWSPTSVEINREFAFPTKEFQEIGIISEEEFNKIFTDICSAKTALTPFDKDALEWFCSNVAVEKYLPSEIPFKETLCVLAQKGYDVPVKTATDVLRIATYMSGKDISLPAISKSKKIWGSAFVDKSQYFIKFTRKQRAYLLSLLEKTNDPASDMKRYVYRWIRLGEILHPGEYKTAYPKAFKAFDKIRNNVSTIKTFASELQRAIDTKNAEKTFELLKSRPGEFARKLNQLFTNDAFKSEEIISNFSEIVDKLSSKNLVELLSYMKERSKYQYFRMITIKGAKTKTKVLPGQNALPDDVGRKLTQILLDEIIKRTRDVDEKEIYIDPQLFRTPYPFAMRSSSESMNTLVRGTRMKISDDVNCIRGFVHWKDDKGNMDLDLSALFLDEQFIDQDQISWTGLKIDKWNCCHSGDIRHKVGSNAEYIDFDIKKLKDGGVKYVLFEVHDFNGKGFQFHEHPITFGWMGVEKPRVQETFTPKNVENSMRLAEDTSTVFAVAFDVDSREMIWVDTKKYTITPIVGSRVENTLTPATAAMMGIFGLVDRKLTIGEYLENVYVYGKGLYPIDAPKEGSLNFDKYIEYNKITTII